MRWAARIAEGGGDDIKYDITIVGVVGDIRHTDLAHAIGRRRLHCPICSRSIPPALRSTCAQSNRRRLLRDRIRQAIHQLDPTLVVDGLRTMEEQVDRNASDERALAFLAIGFSCFGHGACGSRSLRCAGLLH